MVHKGFKKEKPQEKNRKIKQLESNLEDKELLRFKGLTAGKKLSIAWSEQGQEIRSRSEQFYGNSLIEARFLMLAAMCDLLVFRVGIPGETNEETSEILGLIAIYWQGQFYTEKVISEGQYFQAAALIKQEIEILTRIAEIKQGVARKDQVPNVKYAPSNLKLHYGDMNDISHISKTHVVNALNSIDKDGLRGSSIQPLFNEKLSKTFYEIHLSIFYNLILEVIQVFQKLYPDDIELILPACKLLEFVKIIFGESGFTCD